MAKYIFESKGFFTPNDKKALTSSLSKKPLGSSEKRIVLHGRTRLTVEKSKQHGFKVNKNVDGGKKLHLRILF